MAMTDNLSLISSSLKHHSWSPAQSLLLLNSFLDLLAHRTLSPAHQRLLLAICLHLRQSLTPDTKARAVALFARRDQGDVMLMLRVYQTLDLPGNVEVLGGLVQTAARSGNFTPTKVPKFALEAGPREVLDCKHKAGAVFVTGMAPTPELLQDYIASNLAEKSKMPGYLVELYRGMLGRVDADMFRALLLPVFQRLLRRSSLQIEEISLTISLLRLNLSEFAKDLVFPTVIDHLFKPETSQTALKLLQNILERAEDHTELAQSFLQMRDQNELQAVALLRAIKLLKASATYSDSLLDYCLDRNHRLKTEENKAILLDCVNKFGSKMTQKLGQYFEKEGAKAAYVNMYVKLGGTAHICPLTNLTAMQQSFLLSIALPAPCPAGIKSYLTDPASSFANLQPSTAPEALCVTRAALKAFELFPGNAVLVKKLARGLVLDSVTRDLVVVNWPAALTVGAVCGSLIEAFADQYCWDQFRQNYKRLTRLLLEKAASEEDKVGIVRLYASEQVTTEEEMKRLRYFMKKCSTITRALPLSYLCESPEMAALLCLSGHYAAFIAQAETLLQQSTFLDVEQLGADLNWALRDPEFTDLQPLWEMTKKIGKERGLQIAGSSEVPQIHCLFAHISSKAVRNATYVLRVHTLCAHLSGWKSLDTASVQYDLLAKVLLQALGLSQVDELKGAVYTCVTEILKHVKLFQPIYYDIVKVLLALHSSQWPEKSMKHIIKYITDSVSLDSISAGEAFVFNYLLSATVYQDVTNLRTSATHLLGRLVYERKFESLEKVVELGIHLLETYSSQAVSSLLATLATILAPSDWRPLLQASVTLQPASKVILLNNLLQYEEGLPLVEWVEAPLWLLLNDESEEVGELALDVWHKFKLQLSPSTVLNSLPLYLYHENDEVQTITARGLASVWDLCPWLSRPLLDRVLTEFRDRRKHKEGLAHFLHLLAPELAAYSLELLTFIVREGMLEPSSALRDRLIQLGIQLLHLHGLNLVEALFQVLQTAIEGSEDQSKFAAVLLLGNLAEHFPADDIKVNHTIDLLLKALESKHEAIYHPVADCLPRLIAKRREQGQGFVEGYMKVIFSPVPMSDKRGSAFGLAAILKGLGIDSFVKFGVLEKFDDVINNKKSTMLERGSVLLALEGLSSVLKATLEPYLPELVPFILDSYSDSQLMLQAQTTIKTLIAGLSARGVRNVLPLLTNGLEDSKWKTKIGAIEALGKIAFCAPRQLSISLPEVVPQVIKAFSDTHPEVFQAATRALADIGSAIANPEISDIVPILIKALSDASTQKEALSTMLETGFMHFIDAPSLSILIPILESGLKSRQPEVKKMASQIVGGILALVPSARSILPYITRLITALKSALFDSIPEVRNVAAQNLGSLCKFVGLQQSGTIIDWLESIFFTEASTQVERSGAVHAYSEILVRISPNYWEQALPRVLEMCRHPDYFTRVCFLGVLIFLPDYTAGRFEDHLYEMLPVIFENLSHENDEVRSVAVRIMQIIIKGYSRKYLDKLLPPLEAGLFDSNYKTRQSSIILVGEMMEMIESMDRREGKKEGTIPTEEKNRLLSAIYILRSDHTGTIHTQAAKIWKALVENTPRVIPTLTSHVVQRLLEIAESSRSETLNIVTAAIQNILEKYENKLFQDYLNQFALYYDSHPRGVAIAMREICDCATKRMFNTNPESVVRVVRSLLLSSDQNLLTSAGDIFAIIYEKSGTEGSKDILMLLLQSVEGNPKAYRELLRSRNESISKAILPVIMKSPSKADILREVSDLVADELFNLIEFKGMFQTMLRGMRESEAMLEAVMRVMASVTDYTALSAGWDMIGMVESGREVVMIVQEFANSTTLDFVTYIPRLISLVLPSLPTSSPDFLPLLAPTVSALLKPVQKEELYTLLPYLTNELDKWTDPLDLFSLPKALDPFISIVQNSLLSGPAEYKEMAARGYCDLVRLTNAKPLESYVITLAGPLIRVLSERVQHPVRVGILDALQLLMGKGAAKLKTFTPQLRTIFIKSLQHTEESVRAAGMRNLLELIPMETRIDLVVNELCTLKSDPDIVISSLSALLSICQVVPLPPQIRTSATNKLLGDLDSGHLATVLQALGKLLALLVEHPPSVIQGLSRGGEDAIGTLGYYLAELSGEHVALVGEIYARAVESCFDAAVSSMRVVLEKHPLEGFVLVSQSFPVLGRKLTPTVYQLLTEIPSQTYMDNITSLGGLLQGLVETAQYEYQLGRRSRDLDKLLQQVFALGTDAGKENLEKGLAEMREEKKEAMKEYVKELGRE